LFAENNTNKRTIALLDGIFGFVNPIIDGNQDEFE
jgi:hypothetical protein